MTPMGCEVLLAMKSLGRPVDAYELSDMMPRFGRAKYLRTRSKPHIGRFLQAGLIERTGEYPGSYAARVALYALTEAGRECLSVECRP